MLTQSCTIMFPSKPIKGFKFKDIKELRDVLKCQAIENHLSGVESWYHLASQDEKYTILKCKMVGYCKAYIKLLFLGEDGFLIDSLFPHHDHTKNQFFKQIKTHHILSPFIGSFISSKPLKQVYDGLNIVKTNCCCKNNPGETAIAYSVTNSQGQIIIQRSEVFSDFTVNKGQFIVIIYALMDCYENGIMNIEVRSRSKLVIDFMNGVSNISAPGLRDIAEASKLLKSRLSGQIYYKVMTKSESSPKLQNMCRKLLNLQGLQEKKK